MLLTLSIPATAEDRLGALTAKHSLRGTPEAGLELHSIDTPLAQLGKLLFFSMSLAGNRDTACASCHHPLLGGADALSLPIGEGATDPHRLGPGRHHDEERSADPRADGLPNVPRNSPTTFNAALYREALFLDGRVTNSGGGNDYADGIYTPESVLGLPDTEHSANLLEAQTRFPVTSAAEMRGFGELGGRSGREVRQDLVQRLREGQHRDNGNSGVWLQHFRTAFSAPEASAQELISFANISRALAAYQQSQLFTDTPWRRYLGGDLTAINDKAKRGALLFYAEPGDGGAGCVQCHRGDFFTDEQFHNLAIPQFGRGKGKRDSDFGRELISRQISDRYAFRTPSLINVEMSAPYGHTGAYPSLEGVIRHHLNPELAISAYDFSLTGLPGFETPNPRAKLTQRNTEAALKALRAVSSAAAPVPDDTVIAELTAFLRTLTDTCVRHAACLGPWIPVPSEDPDGFQLNAVISGGVPAATGVVSTSRLRFTEVGARAGLTHQHAVRLLSSDLLNNANQALRMAGGVAAGDYDGDGWTDLYMVTGSAASTTNRLYRNAGDGSFVDVTDAAGVGIGGDGSGPIFVDFDGDGRLDLFVGGVHILEELARTDGRLRLERLMPTWPHWFRNRGDGTFEDVTSSVGVEVSRNTFSATFSDVDRDGDLDVFLTHWDVVAESEQVHLWFNDGTGHFIASGPKAGFTGLFLPKDFSFTANFADIDGDRWPDLLLAADFLTSRVFRNLGGGRFEEITDPEVIADENGMGAAVGDYDNDGDLDWFVSSVWDSSGKPHFGAWGTSGNRLYRNRGDGSFEDATDIAGVRQGDWGWGSCFSDFDNDGDLDLFHVNGYGDSRVSMWKDRVGHLEHTAAKLFVNTGNGKFEEDAAGAGIADTGQGRGVVCFDYDNDGDIDVLIATSGGPPTLYRNELTNDSKGAPTHYLQVQLRGTARNRQGLGARVEIETTSGRQVREIRNENNFVSQNPAISHFGLGLDERVRRLRVLWPEADGPVTELTDLAVDRIITVVHPAAD